MRGDFNDLTKGGVTKQLVRYAIPMVVTSLLQACYSMADLLIAGHFIGSSGISAINNSSQIVLILTNIAIGLTTRRYDFNRPMLWGRQPGKAEKGNRNPGDLVYGAGSSLRRDFFPGGGTNAEGARRPKPGGS